MSLNKVMLIGNVGKEPEVRYLDGGAQGAQGRKVATFTLATTEKYRDRSGEMRENTEWHNIVAWSGKNMPDFSRIGKGTPVYVCGRLRSSKYTAGDGTERQIYEVIANKMAIEEDGQ